MAGLAYMEKQPYIDTDRMAAAGASFGGYMMDWFEGHTTKFKTLISHCGVYNFDSMYATTDEIWFDEWEHHGTPWDKDRRESFEKFSPHRYADKFQTPMLIIHNDLDFRVPVGEGLQLFNTLQRKGIPSKLINFPDEGHWVSKAEEQRILAQGGIRLAGEVRPARREIRDFTTKTQRAQRKHKEKSIAKFAYSL